MVDFLMWLLVTSLAFNLIATPCLFLCDCICMFITKEGYQDWCGWYLKKKFEVLGPLGKFLKNEYSDLGMIGWMSEVVISAIAFLVVGMLIVTGVYVYLLAIMGLIVSARLLYPSVKEGK